MRIAKYLQKQLIADDSRLIIYDYRSLSRLQFFVNYKF